MQRFTKTQLRRGTRVQDSAKQPVATSADEQAFLLGEAAISSPPPLPSEPTRPFRDEARRRDQPPV